MDKHRIEFVNIDLNIDIKKEIEKETNIVSNEIKVYMQDLLHSRLTPQKKSVKQDQQQTFWHDKLDILLKRMLETNTLSKEDIAQCLGISLEDLGPAIMRFKHFLKARKEGAYILKKHAKGGIRCYTLLYQS